MATNLILILMTGLRTLQWAGAHATVSQNAPPGESSSPTELPAPPERPCRPAESRRRSGFTLIELLVVIGIIAVLAGILLPVLTKAKAAAHRVGCLTRLKQWAVAFTAYADDNDGWIPREGYHANGNTFWNNWAHVQHARSRDVWYNALSNYVGVPPAARYALPEDRLDFYEPRSLFHCPSARFPGEARSPGYQIALFSIAMNSQLINLEHFPTTRITRIHDLSRTVLFLDNLLDGEKPVVDAQARTYLGQPAAEAGRFAGNRHVQTGNLIFADGHAESAAGPKVVETQGPNRGWAIQPPKDVFWQAEDE